MSELKVILATPHPKMKNACDGAIEVYSKSEADKVIAELKQKINEAQTELELWRDGSIISETHQKEFDEKRHSDYKRCLAMAKWCEAEAYKCLTQQSALICFQEKDNFQYLQRSFMHFRRWHKRWLKIAEQFKEAK